MSYKIGDRVRQTSTTGGTGPQTLIAASAGYQNFSAVLNDGDTCPYLGDDGAGNWELGIGTYHSSGPTLTRTTVLDSSNGGSAVNFGISAVTWSISLAAALIPFLDASGDLTIAGAFKSASLQLGSGSVISTLAQGTWTPADASGASLSITVNKAEYFQIGNLVIAYFNVTYPATASGSAARIGGLPAAVASPFTAWFLVQTFSNTAVAVPTSGTSQVWLFTNQGITTQLTNANLSGLQVIAMVIYFSS